MSKNLKYFLIFFIVVVSFLSVETIFLTVKNKNIEQKRLFVEKIGLPDLAISTEAKYIRHRSITDIFSIFNENPIAISYFVTTFAYAPSPNLNNTPNIIEEK